jgi:taurine--2-oxoglutarate transaminase
MTPWSVQSDGAALLSITGGEGVYFYDAQGRRYLDFSSQLMNLNLGYGHKGVIEAIKNQAERLCYVAPFMTTAPRERLGELLAEVTPGNLSTVFFTNSGSEANDIAFMMARMVTGRSKIFAKYRSYHGTTLGTLAVGGDPRRHHVEPGAPGTVRFFDPYCYRCSFGLRYPECDLHCARSIEELILYEGPSTVAAVVVEPVTGGNGAIVPPPNYLNVLREICDRYGILLIADEVICGFGRTGRWFGVEHWSVTPDIMTLAKGITSGYVPLGAVIVTDQVARHFEREVLPLGCTYSAHPLACAAGVAAIEAYRDEGLIENAAKMGTVLLHRLKEMASRHSLIGDVRGLGLIACIELVRDRRTRKAFVEWNTTSETTDLIKRKLLARGVFTYVRWNWIFIAPPLCITEDEIDQGLVAIDETLTELEGSREQPSAGT